MHRSLALNHLVLPARDPDSLAAWYARMLDFRRDGRALWSMGTLILVQEGEPIAEPAFRLGFRLDTIAELDRWISRLRERGAVLDEGERDPVHASVSLEDPEGHRIELFWEREPRPGGRPALTR